MKTAANTARSTIFFLW